MADGLKAPPQTMAENSAPAPQAEAADSARRDALAERRLSMRRFEAGYRDLPVATTATCPICRRVGPATFDRVGTQIVLNYDCPSCGKPYREVHFDGIWTDSASDYPGSAARTFHGSRIRPILRRLPRTVETLCPVCGAIILGRYFVADGAVFIEKTCPDHGYFKDRISSDVLLYSKSAWWSYEEPPGQEFPQVLDGQNCPSDCGLCNQHLSGSVLAQIDLTNRCNMRCPICFANAGSAGYVCQPDYDQIVKQLKALRDLRPIPCTAIQFTGGEPTIHPDFLRIVSTARDMGFSYIQAATNGLTLAEPDFARRCAAAGLHTLYLQFDGVGEDAYRYTRAFPGIWDKKLATIENARACGMKICLVPTILKGVNDQQVGEVFRFAIRNIDVVSGISYQPVAFGGRIDPDELARRRYTLADLGHDIAAASGASALRDMFPLSIVTPLAQILATMTGNPKISPTCHPDCAFGTYFFISPDGQAYPFPQVIDVEGMFVEMNRLAARIRRRGRATWLDKVRLLRLFKRQFRPDSAPDGLDLGKFMRSIKGLIDKKAGRGDGEKHTYKTLLCAGMHFQDRFNFDVERVKRCVILYSTPAGIFPFCTYNCGPEYRPIVERAFAESSSTTTEQQPPD